MNTNEGKKNYMKNVFGFFFIAEVAKKLAGPKNRRKSYALCLWKIKIIHQLRKVFQMNINTLAKIRTP